MTKEEILRYADKINENQKEKENFSKNLDKYLSDPVNEKAPIRIGMTPNSLIAAGAKPIDLYIYPRTIKKCMEEPENHYHGHGLSADIIREIPEHLKEPVMVFKGSKENSLVAVTDILDKEGRGIIIPINLNDEVEHKVVNKISSTYGRNNFAGYIKKQMENGNLISINIEKAEKLMQSCGLQSPTEGSVLSFDNSISYSLENIKPPEEKNQYFYENISEKIASDIKNYGFTETDSLTEKYKKLDEMVGFHVPLVQVCEWNNGLKSDRTKNLCPEKYEEIILAIGEECKQQQEYMEESKKENIKPIDDVISQRE